MPGRRSVVVYPYVKIDSYGTGFTVTAECRPIKKVEAGGVNNAGVAYNTRQIIVMRVDLNGKTIKQYDVIRTDDGGGYRWWQVMADDTKGLAQRIVLDCNEVKDPSLTAGIS